VVPAKPWSYLISIEKNTAMAAARQSDLSRIHGDDIDGLSCLELKLAALLLWSIEIKCYGIKVTCQDTPPAPSRNSTIIKFVNALGFKAGPDHPGPGRILGRSAKSPNTHRNRQKGTTNLT
jgi:hypothetical protein